MSMTRGPEQVMWPHNQAAEDEEIDTPMLDPGAFFQLPPGGEPGQLLALNERHELIWVDPPSTDPLASSSGLFDKTKIPVLDESHLPPLAGTYQAVEERDKPHGYAGLDASGKISAYALPSIARGLQGAQGPQGPSGQKGDRGERGEPGPAGLQGARGPQGEAGPQGAQGARGIAPDLGEYVKRLAARPTISLSSETLARDIAYLLAELEIINLV